MDGWSLYVLRCADGSLYTGITKDLERRLEEHNTSRLGARYTRTRRPVRVVYAEVWATRSEAAAREYEIKQMTRQRKQELVARRSAGGHTRS